MLFLRKYLLISSPKLIITILFLIILSINPAIAETEIDQAIFDSSYPTVYRTDVLRDWSSAIQKHLHCLEINNVNFVQTGLKQFTAKIERSIIDTYTLTEPYTAYGGEVRIDSDTGTIVGTTKMVHVRSTEDYIIIVIDFMTLDLSAYSGQHTLHVMDLKLDELKTGQATQTDTPTGSTDIFISYYADKAIATYHTLDQEDSYYDTLVQKDFYSTVHLYQNSSTMYRLFFDRNLHESKINISIYDGVNHSLYYQDDGYISNDTNIFIPTYLLSSNDQIYINCIDLTEDFYEAYLSISMPPPADDGVLNTLSGVVVNAVDNTLLDEVNISLSSNTGYGGYYQDISNLGFYEITNIIDDNYNLSVNHTSFEPYQRDLELTEDLELNIPLIPTDLVTLGTNLTGIYGIVSDHYTEQPVPNVIVRVENNTYSDFTVTNQNGYYQFTNITAGNYTVEANKVEYYPYQQKNLTTTANDMLVHNFDMVLLVEPIETVSDELEDVLGLDEVTEEDILHFLKTYGFWLFILALIFFMYAAYKSSGIDRWF